MRERRGRAVAKAQAQTDWRPLALTTFLIVITAVLTLVR